MCREPPWRKDQPLLELSLPRESGDTGTVFVSSNVSENKQAKTKKGPVFAQNLGFGINERGFCKKEEEKGEKPSIS